LYKYLNYDESRSVQSTHSILNTPLDDFYNTFFKKNFFFKKKNKFFRSKLAAESVGNHSIWSNFIISSKIKLKSKYLYGNSFGNTYQYNNSKGGLISGINTYPKTCPNTINIHSHHRTSTLLLQKLNSNDRAYIKSTPNKPIISTLNFLKNKTYTLDKKPLNSIKNLFIPNINMGICKKNTISQNFNSISSKYVVGNFLFQNVGLFILNKLNTEGYKQSDSVKFKIKKKLFSFVFPNEIKNNFLRLKKLITFYSVIYKLNFNYNKNLNISSQINNVLKVNQKFFQNSEAVNYFYNLNQMGNSKTFNTYGTKINYINSTHNFLLKEQVTQQYTNDKNLFLKEVRINRIKFRPGYQRLWRKARTALKEALNLHFIYQKQLTKYLVQFFKWTKIYAFANNELSLEKVSLYSHLVPDLSTFNLFLKNKLIYLNGRLVFSKNLVVSIDDSIQVIVSK
jgi:hypothetical protein